MRYPILYTDRFLAPWMGGRSIGPLILLRPLYRGDAALIAHELEHVQQWAVAWLAWAALVVLALPDMPELIGLGIGLHALAYRLLRPYRRWCEIAAYAAQARAQDQPAAYLGLYALSLSRPEYDLGLDHDTALAALTHEVNTGRGVATAAYLTPVQIARGCGCSNQSANRWAPHLNTAMAAFDINTPKRMAAFLAQVAHESGRFMYVRELWGPTPTQTRYEGRADLGNTQPGDGYLFRGRGLIQITGRDNYRAASIALFDTPSWLLTHPEELEKPEHAARSAAWFWREHGLNELADQGPSAFERITRRINGGLNGQAERLSLYKSMSAELGLGSGDA